VDVCVLMCVGKRFWNFPRLAGDCGSDQRKRLPDCVSEISENCSQMMLQFHNQIEVSLNLPICHLVSLLAFFLSRFNVRRYKRKSSYLFIYLESLLD